MVDVKLVVVLDIPVSELNERIALRWTHEPSGRTYDSAFNPPIKFAEDNPTQALDTVTGEPLVRRGDDASHLATMKRRNIYHENLDAIEDFYVKKGERTGKSILHRIRGDGFPDLVEQNKRSMAIIKQIEKDDLIARALRED